MSTTSASRHRPISFVGKWLDTIEERPAPQSTSYPRRSPIPSASSNLTGSTLVWPRARQDTGITQDTRVVVIKSPRPKKSKRDSFRAIFRSWKATLTTRTTSHEAFPATVRDNPELAIAELSSHLSANFAVLIETALRNSPSKALSARRICKEIMRADNWYRAHEKFGWQESVARELSLNPSFQPVIECREGRVRNTRVKWQLTAVDASLAPATAPWRPPQDSVPYPLELSTEVEATERQTEPSRAENSDTPQSRRPSAGLPALAALASASLLSSALPLHPAEDTIPKEEALVSGFSKRLFFKAPGPSRSPANISFNDTPPPSHQSGENGFRPDKGDNTEKGPELPRGRGSNDEQKHPGRSDGNEGNEGRKRQRLSSPERTTTKRRFACVYHKYDPITYSVQDVRYRTCTGPGFKYVSELSRHLTRNHHEYVCVKCLRHYDNASDLSIHVEHCTVPPRSYTQEQGWEMLWRFRFPEDPVPDDIYTSAVLPSLRPPPPSLDIPESLPVQVDSSARPSPASSTALSADPLATADTSSAQVSTPSSAQQPFDSPLPITAAVRVLERHIHCIEKRLSLVENTTIQLLQKWEMPSGRGPNLMVPAQIAEASSLGSSIYSRCNPSNGSMLSPGNYNPSFSQSNNSLSNCPPLGSSTAVTTRTPSEKAPSEELFSPHFDVLLSFENPDNPRAGATNADDDGGRVEDSFMPDLDLEAWNEEHNGALGSVPSFVFSGC
ncbi:hypothetical protein BDW72DRAFT_168592 [Aspergillus terricola var. indicus]